MILNYPTFVLFVETAFANTTTMNKKQDPPSLDKLMAVVQEAVRQEDYISEKIRRDKKENRLLTVVGIMLFLISLTTLIFSIFLMIWFVTR
jgi:hypothetical protein